MAGTLGVSSVLPKIALCSEASQESPKQKRSPWGLVANSSLSSSLLISQWKITKAIQRKMIFLYTHVNKRTYNFPFLPRRVLYFLFFAVQGKMLRSLRALSKCQEIKDTELRNQKGIFRKQRHSGKGWVCRRPVILFHQKISVASGNKHQWQGEVENSRKGRTPGSGRGRKHPFQTDKAVCILTD